MHYRRFAPQDSRKNNPNWVFLKTIIFIKHVFIVHFEHFSLTSAGMILTIVVNKQQSLYESTRDCLQSLWVLGRMQPNLAFYAREY